ncbi:MAG: RagB/SusD family nutrient uptake outer membrane protein [Prevotellaceae bacterium]|jgi:hypothetical protein|nr:RagB/SusD family nutrient uptake outer membrane protein [Prevotellaceae bacterium]
MKKIIPIIAMLLAALSCSEFLDIRPEGTTEAQGTDYSKSENMFLPVSAAYASLRNYAAHSFPYISVFEISSDDADKGSEATDGPNQKDIDEFKHTPATAILNEIWGGFYDIVSAANYAIEQMPLFEAAQQDATNKNYARQCAAEAKVIRAYAYFNLTRMFGRVYIANKTCTAAELAALPQATTAQLYEFIEKDLEEAIPALPPSYSKEWAGRITSYTALGIKAKVHLYQAEYDSVAACAGRIIASARYDLLPDFKTVFRAEGENSRESLFEIQSTTLGLTAGEAPYITYAYIQGPRGNQPGNMQGWGFCVPSQKLINFFAARGDNTRAAVTLLRRGTKTAEGDSISSRCSNPVYNGKVYTPSGENKWSYNGYGFNHNVRILRYADVLLMYAEALVRGSAQPAGVTMTGTDALNKVRERVGLAPVPLTTDNVLDERRAELALEEDRFFDLVRTGRAAAELAAKGFQPGKHEVFPIPSAQRQLNLNLNQNTGY